MAAAVATRIVGDLKDPEYLNWVKANRALHRTIDVLRHVCSAEMKEFQQWMLAKCGRNICRTCTCRNITTSDGGFSWFLDNHCNRCSPWLAEIVKQRTEESTKLNLQNSDVRQWKTHSWQIAKIFMLERQERATIDPADTDPTGILQLLLNCCIFSNMLTRTKVDAVS